MKKVVKSISVNPEILKGIEKIAKDEDRSVSSVIGLALKDYIKK